jgi:hypothetical protein
VWDTKTYEMLCKVTRTLLPPLSILSRNVPLLRPIPCSLPLCVAESRCPGSRPDAALAGKHLHCDVFHPRHSSLRACRSTLANGGPSIQIEEALGDGRGPPHGADCRCALQPPLRGAPRSCMLPPLPLPAHAGLTADSMDGIAQVMLSVDYDGRAIVWHVDTGLQQRAFPIGEPNTCNEITVVEFDLSQRRLLIGTANGQAEPQSSTQGCSCAYYCAKCDWTRVRTGVDVQLEQRVADA